MGQKGPNIKLSRLTDNRRKITRGKPLKLVAVEVKAPPVSSPTRPTSGARRVAAHWRRDYQRPLLPLFLV
jgi:hypothetical protein